MSYNSNLVVPGNGNMRDTLAPVLTAAGFTRVTQGYVPAATYTLDVWKSPAGSNAAGQDWYLMILDSVNGANHQVGFSVCEGWDDATKLATKYVPATTSGNTPAADFSIGSTGVAPTVGNIFFPMHASNQSWAHSAGTTVVISATVDRVILRYTAGGFWDGYYLGHLDRIYPTSIDPVQPLVVSRLDAQGAAPTTAGQSGGTTRDPGLATAAGWAFRIVCYNSGSTLTQATVRQMVSYVDSVTGKPWSSRGGPQLARAYNSSLRGLFKDIRMGQAATTPGIGDTMTETQPDGSTVTYWLASVANGGYWALAV